MATHLARRPQTADGTVGRGSQGGASMLVATRCRPLSRKEEEAGHRVVVRSFPEDRLTRITKIARDGAVLRSEQGSQHEYCYDHCFGPEATQAEVYESAARRTVREVLKGTHATIFAYGSTGAGKTHTMMGSDAQPGIIPRALSDVFHGIAEIATSEQDDPQPGVWSVRVSFLEVYNETIVDLLVPVEKQRPLQPCEDPSDSTIKVLGLSDVVVNDVESVLDLLAAGNERRRMEPTAANQVSSRSHAVLQVFISCVRTVSPLGARRVKKQRTTSRLSLIDLAGSERASSTQNRGARLREGANINKSLLALANCINALSNTRQHHGAGGKRRGRGAVRVKYRDSKLTHLLKSSLEGDCHLTMIAALNPSHRNYEESHNTLKYANRAKNIKVSAKVNRTVEEDSAEFVRIAELEAENQQLRSKIAWTEKHHKPGSSSSSPSLRMEDVRRHSEQGNQTKPAPSHSHSRSFSDVAPPTYGWADEADAALTSVALGPATRLRKRKHSKGHGSRSSLDSVDEESKPSPAKKGKRGSAGVRPTGAASMTSLPSSRARRQSVGTRRSSNERVFRKRSVVPHPQRAAAQQHEQRPKRTRAARRSSLTKLTSARGAKKPSGRRSATPPLLPPSLGCSEGMEGLSLNSPTLGENIDLGASLETIECDAGSDDGKDLAAQVKRLTYENRLLEADNQRFFSELEGAQKQMMAKDEEIRQLRDQLKRQPSPPPPRNGESAPSVVGEGVAATGVHPRPPRTRRTSSNNNKGRRLQPRLSSESNVKDDATEGHDASSAKHHTGARAPSKRLAKAARTRAVESVADRENVAMEYAADGAAGN